MYDNYIMIAIGLLLVATSIFALEASPTECLPIGRSRFILQLRRFGLCCSWLACCLLRLG
jgi:hypothetical protein